MVSFLFRPGPPYVLDRVEITRTEKVPQESVGHVQMNPYTVSYAFAYCSLAGARLRNFVPNSSSIPAVRFLENQTNAVWNLRR